MDQNHESREEMTNENRCTENKQTNEAKRKKNFPLRCVLHLCFLMSI